MSPCDGPQRSSPSPCMFGRSPRVVKCLPRWRSWASHAPQLSLQPCLLIPILHECSDVVCERLLFQRKGEALLCHFSHSEVSLGLWKCQAQGGQVSTHIDGVDIPLPSDPRVRGHFPEPSATNTLLHSCPHMPLSPLRWNLSLPAAPPTIPSSLHHS